MNLGSSDGTRAPQFPLPCSFKEERDRIRGRRENWLFHRLEVPDPSKIAALPPALGIRVFASPIQMYQAFLKVLASRPTKRNNNNDSGFLVAHRSPV